MKTDLIKHCMTDVVSQPQGTVKTRVSFTESFQLTIIFSGILSLAESANTQDAVYRMGHATNSLNARTFKEKIRSFFGNSPHSTFIFIEEFSWILTRELYYSIKLSSMMRPSRNSKKYDFKSFVRGRKKQ